MFYFTGLIMARTQFYNKIQALHNRQAGSIEFLAIIQQHVNNIYINIHAWLIKATNKTKHCIMCLNTEYYKK